ncbi:MAG: hypothetical protein JNM59_03165 [Hyphomonadaceae bacterium]|nr:hypothetical protein [Hyphomonadaceae bacterium]
MRKILMGVAAAAALAPAVASAETNATIGIQYSNLGVDGSSYDFDTYGFNGAFNHDFDNGWQVQMDGAANRVDAGGCCISQNYAAAHYGMRSDTHSVAGYVGLQDFYLYSGLAFGVEGQLHLSNTTLGGSVSHVTFGDIDLDATVAHVDGAYFITPDFSLTGSVSYGDFDGSDGTMWGIGGEYRFAGSPTSVSLGYRQGDMDSFEVDAWTIGLNFDLGTGSLQERTQSGPSWSGAKTLNDAFGMLVPII